MVAFPAAAIWESSCKITKLWRNGRQWGRAWDLGTAFWLFSAAYCVMVACTLHPVKGNFPSESSAILWNVLIKLQSFLFKLLFIWLLMPCSGSMYSFEYFNMNVKGIVWWRGQASTDDGMISFLHYKQFKISTWMPKQDYQFIIFVLFLFV